MDPRRPSVVFWSAVAAGVLWLVAWAHLLAAHGVTQQNEQNVVLGFTWLDSSRLVLFALIAAFISTAAMLRRAHGHQRTAMVVAAAGFALCAVGVVLGFWLQPWRTYQGASRETGAAAAGGGLVAVGSVVFAVGLVLTAVALVRTRVLARWAGVVLAVGAVSTVPWLHETTFPGPVFGLAWLALAMYWRGSERRSDRG